MSDHLGSTASDQIKVLIVEDHTLLADAVRAELEESGMLVCGVVSSMADALAAVDAYAPDLVLMDIGLPDADGADIARSVVAASPQTKILFLSAMNNPRRLQELIKEGFHGYLTKDTPLEDFVTSVRAVLAGQVVVSSGIASGAAGGRTPEEEDAELRAGQLTPREREVLALLASGASSEVVAAGLGITLNTARTHIQHVLTKLQVSSRLEAVTFALKNGIVRPGKTSGL